jgi:hypothetical protein
MARPRTQTPSVHPEGAVSVPIGAQTGQQIGRQGQRASRQDPSMNPRIIAKREWKDAAIPPKDEESGSDTGAM